MSYGSVKVCILVAEIYLLKLVCVPLVVLLSTTEAAVKIATSFNENCGRSLSELRAHRCCVRHSVCGGELIVVVPWKISPYFFAFRHEKMILQVSGLDDSDCFRKNGRDYFVPRRVFRSAAKLLCRSCVANPYARP